MLPDEVPIHEALARSDHRAAATLTIRLYGPRVLGYLHRVLGSDTDAADAFSLFTEQIWKGIPGFEGRSSVKTWAFKAAWTAAMKVKDDAWRRLRRRLDTTDAERLAVEVRTLTSIRQERQREELELLRSELSTEDQTLLVLRLDQRLSWDEVAEVFSQEGAPVQPATLRKRYERIKARLGEILERKRREHP